MRNRLPQTLVDGLVIAVNPALIMLLVGSLVFFLVEVFYHGQYQGRLLFIFSMFVLATVLIGRISIAEGNARASLFGLPLAVLTGIAVVRFAQISGPLTVICWPINWGLLALIWWAAHKLTWDCTVIDDEQDASGEGLLRAAGLEGPQESGTPRQRPDSEAAEDGPPATLRAWLQRIARRRRRPHAPGVWVVYFSLAALPLFGLGQWIIGAEVLSSRRYAFFLLCVYVASGLALLMTTSLLGLRRYLRQRQVQMPGQIAATWVAVGCGLIVAVMLAAWLMPRRSPEYSITQIPIDFDSPDHRQTSRFAVGNDGPRDEEKGDRVGNRSAPDGRREGDGRQRSDSGSQGHAGDDSQDEDQHGGAGGDKPNGQGPNGHEPNGQGKQAGEDAAADDDEDSPSGDSSGDANSQGGGSGGGEGQGEGQGESDGSSGEGSNSDTQQGSDSQSGDERSGQGRSGDGGSRRDSRSSQTESSSQQAQQNAAEGLLMLLKWLFYLIFFLAVLFVAWRYRKEIQAAWQRLVAELRELWENLFGRPMAKEAVAASEQVDREPPPRPFADFSDPFVSGQAGRLSAEELVQYSFEAFEAWAREHKCPRADQQTPHEFASLVGAQQRPLARDARNLAELYSRAAYASDPLPPESVAHMRKFWQQLGSLPRV